MPEQSRHGKAGWAVTWFGPAPAGTHTETGLNALALPTDATQRGQTEINLAGGLAASRLKLAWTALATAHHRNNRLTLELSGHINREAIDWSA